MRFTGHDDSRPAVRPLHLFGILLGAALAVGLLEVLLLGARRLLTGQLVWAGPRVAWMAPLGYAMLALLPAALLAAFTWRRPALGPLALGTGLGGLAAVSTVTLLRIGSEQRLHLVALAVAGAGVGLQLARAVYRRPRTAVRAGLALAAVCSAATGLAGAWVETAPLRQGAGQVKAVPGRPNVLLLVLDTVRALELGLYGFGRPVSPVLDSLGTRGVVFENAFATSSWTLPSHASMFTGRFPHELEAGWRWPLEESVPTVAERLRAAGYRTGGFVGNLYYTTCETGLARGFERYEEVAVSPRQLRLSTEFGQLAARTRGRIILRQHDAKRSERIIADFLRWQEGLGDAPFFAFLNLFDAHWPRYAPDSLARRFRGKTGSPDEDAYAAAVAYMDAQIGSLLAELGRRGELERTVVVITSDHGEQFGGNGLYEHGNSLYANVLRVPLLVLLPDGSGAGLRIRQPVSLRSLARTLLELGAGSGDRLIPGTSLSRFWRAADPAAEPQDSPVLAELTPSPRAPAAHRNARGEVRSLVRGRWHVIANAEGAIELFDYWSDPRESRNLATDSAAAAGPALTRMLARMRALDSLFPREPAHPGI